MNYLNMQGFNTPRTATDPYGMAGPNGAQNRAPSLYGSDTSATNPDQPWWNDSVYSGSPWGRDETTNKLLQLGFGGQANWQKFLSDWAQPQFMSTLQDTYGGLTPMGAQSRVSGFRTGRMNDATEQGMSDAGRLKALGFSDATQAGAGINAHNKAQEDTNAYWQQEADPYQMQLKKLGLLGQAGNSPNSQYYSQLLGLAHQEQKDPGFLGSVLGLAGGLASGGAFNDLFKRP